MVACLPVPDGILCVGGPSYEYDGWLFEVHPYSGPCPLNRRTGDPRVRIPKSFWAVWSHFETLSPEERKQYEV